MMFTQALWRGVCHERTQGLLRVVACTAVTVPGLGFAQPVSPQAPADLPVIELAATIARAYPEVVVVSCCQLRTPPQFDETDVRYTVVSLGAEARLYWARRLSALVDLSWNGNASRDISYARPASAPPPLIPGAESLYVVDRKAQRRGWALSIVQSIDVARSGRWRPWLGGGFAFERVIDHYEQNSAAFSDPARTFLFAADREQTIAAGVAAGGVRLYIGTKVFVAGDGALRLYFGAQPFSSSIATWRVGIGVGL